MWILLISLQNSQSPLVSLTIIQPPSNEKLLWSSPFTSSLKKSPLKKKKSLIYSATRGKCMISSVELFFSPAVGWETLRVKKSAKVAHSFGNGYTALTWVSKWLCKPWNIHIGEEEKCRAWISRHSFWIPHLQVNLSYRFFRLQPSCCMQLPSAVFTLY